MDKKKLVMVLIVIYIVMLSFQLLANSFAGIIAITGLQANQTSQQGTVAVELLYNILPAPPVAGGGGGGGGDSSESCSERWTCESWSDCSTSNSQTRDCEEQDCGGGSRTESRECTFYEAPSELEELPDFIEEVIQLPRKIIPVFEVIIKPKRDLHYVLSAMVVLFGLLSLRLVFLWWKIKKKLEFIKNIGKIFYFKYEDKDTSLKVENLKKRWGWTKVVIKKKELNKNVKNVFSLFGYSIRGMFKLGMDMFEIMFLVRRMKQLIKFHSKYENV